MERFHLIDEAAAILITRGVYRQAKVYRRGDELFAAHGSGFIRLYAKQGTSLPNTLIAGIDLPPGKVSADPLGRLSWVAK